MSVYTIRASMLIAMIMLALSACGSHSEEFHTEIPAQPPSVLTLREETDGAVDNRSNTEKEDICVSETVEEKLYPDVDRVQENGEETEYRTVWENPLSVEDCKKVMELGTENFMIYAYPKWYITEEERKKIDQEGIAFVFVDPMEENSSLVKPTLQNYHIENDPDRFAMLKAEKYLGWSVFLIKPHDTNEWMVIDWGK